MTITTIAFDGDDTLWHHENYMNEAQDEFQAFMNALGPYSDARKKLEDKHIADLGLWGYGVKSLVLSMLNVALEMTHDNITGKDLHHILDIGKKLYLHPIKLLDHVAETIGKLHQRYQLILVTKGDLIAQEMKVSKSGIAKYFDAIEIVSEKNIETYHKIMARYHIEPQNFIMIGNSIKSDILPVIQSGGQAIHIPYHTTWHHENAALAESDKGQFIVLPSMKDVPELLERLEKSGQDRLSAVCPQAA